MLLSQRFKDSCIFCPCNLCMDVLLQISLVNMLYQKSLRINQATKGALGVGKIVNLQSNDAAKLWGLAQYLHILWSGPFQVRVVYADLRQMVAWRSEAPPEKPLFWTHPEAGSRACQVPTECAPACGCPFGDAELRCGFTVCVDLCAEAV